MARRPPTPADDRARCAWAGTDPLYRAYHDLEWGVPLHDDRRLFELLCLEGAQAGLSWITILRKRGNYRRAFDRFDPKKIAAYRAAKIRALLADPGIVRNRLKVEGVVRNARAYLALRAELGSFDGFLWSFVGGEPRQNGRQRMKDVPPTTPESDALSRALQKRGFTFVGSTICYAFMQAAGLVNDHVVDCFRHAELARGQTSTSRRFGADTR
jgi:DNA-3-methyladenine glycosylase I